MSTAACGRLPARLLAGLVGALVVLALWLGVSASLAHAAPKPPQRVAYIGTATVHTIRAPFSPGLRRGAHGKQVAAAQYVLTGEKPNAYPGIHPFRGRRLTGQFGKFTTKAVLRARWLLGEPVGYRAYCRCRPGKRAVFDRDLYLLLTGRKTRPLGWFPLRAKRIALADRVQPSRPSTSTCAKRIVSFAQHEVGVHEQPWGSNDGPRVRFYQSSTGQYRQAWCDSFVMKDYELAGVWPYTRFAGVYLTVEQAREHTLLRSTPTAGALVAYVRWAGRIRIDNGHIGVVERVTRDGFWTIEGNSSRYHRDPWGGGVIRHFRRFGDATVFIYPPCLTATARGRR